MESGGLLNLSEILFSFVWIGGWIAASVWFRRANGRSIIPQKPTNAEFLEDWCSGRSLRNYLTRVGGAHNCLLVHVSDGQLVVTPRFPFTLLFLPELFGLDIRVSTASIASVEPVRRLWSRMLRVSFDSGALAPIELKLHDERRFLESLGRHAQVRVGTAITAPLKPRRSFRLIFFRLFMGVWGTGALTAALSGLPDDYRFRRDGVETVGVFDSHTGVIGDRNDRGVLSYSVRGNRFHLTSLQGNGVYEVGGTAKLFYMPDKPEDAREAAYLPFNLMWLLLGIVALTLSIFGGWIARRIWR
jgi:hypothetical protein